MPEVVHRRTGAGAEDAAALIGSPLPRVVEEADHGVQKFRTCVVATQLRSTITKLVLQGDGACKVVLHGGDQFVLAHGMIAVDVGLHRSQLIDGGGEAGAVDAVVVVLCTLGDVVAVVAHQYGLIGCGFDPQIPVAGLLAIGLGDLRQTHLLQQRLKAVAVPQLRKNYIAHQLRVGDCADVGNVHRNARDDELPAGCDGVVARVLELVAHLHQRGNDHVVVGVLREAQALLGQLSAQLVELDGRVLVHAQVDLGIDATVVQAGLQADVGQLVHGAAAVGLAAAQHHALAVVALLHADVKVAVAIEGEEELLRQCKRLFLGEPAGLDIRFIVGIHVLIVAAHGVVVDVGGPQAEVQDAEHLHRRQVAVRTIADSMGQGLVLVAVRVSDHRIDGRAHILVACVPARQQAALQHALPVAGDVADAALLVNVVASHARFLFALGVDVREGDDRAPRRDVLAIVADDLLFLKKQLQPQRRTRGQAERRILYLCADRIPALLAQFTSKCLDVAHSNSPYVIVVLL